MKNDDEVCWVKNIRYTLFFYDFLMGLWYNDKNKRIVY